MNWRNYISEVVPEGRGRSMKGASSSAGPSAGGAHTPLPLATSEAPGGVPWDPKVQAGALRLPPLRAGGPNPERLSMTLESRRAGNKKKISESSPEGSSVWSCGYESL